MAELILVRHGQSQANVDRCFAADGSVPLTEQGEREAQALAEVVQARFAPVAIYTSPFRRALDTARFIARAVGLEPQLVPHLHEQDYGVLNGQGFEALATLPPLKLESFWDWKAPGGESLREVMQRVGPVFDELAERHLGEQIVVVSHAGVMMALRGHATRDTSFAPTLSGNASGFLLRRTPNGYEGPISVEGLTRDITPHEEMA